MSKEFNTEKNPETPADGQAIEKSLSNNGKASRVTASLPWLTKRFTRRSSCDVILCA